jgi:AcrR family transcriptional regulator
MDRPNLLKGEDLLPEPVQLRSRQKRTRIKAAGLALFGEKGYDRTSVDEITAKAKLATGGFYQHFRSKQQLLLVLMDELLESLSRLDLRPKGASNIREGLRGFLTRALSADLQYLGGYRAWREAAITDAILARKEVEIRTWTTARVYQSFNLLQQLPGARRGVDLKTLAQVMDGFFWNLLAQAVTLAKVDLEAWIDSATHLIFHALFEDPPKRKGRGCASPNSKELPPTSGRRA